MIDIRYTQHGNHITSLEISGHAGFAESGKDLVCAAVSGITFGLLNALDELTDVNNMTVGDNLIQVKVDNPTAESDLLLSAGIIQLKTVQQQNQRFIKIKKMEV